MANAISITKSFTQGTGNKIKGMVKETTSTNITRNATSVTGDTICGMAKEL